MLNSFMMPLTTIPGKAISSTGLPLLRKRGLLLHVTRLQQTLTTVHDFYLLIH